LHASTITFIRLFVIIIFSGGFVFWPNYVAANDIANPHTPSLHNQDGEKISVVEVGQQSIIRVSFHNDNSVEQPFVLLVEVRDGNDVTQYLSWQIGRIESNTDYAMETSWTPRAYCDVPSEACSNYEIRSFVVKSLEDPQLLAPLSISSGIIVTGSPPIGPRSGLYDLVLNNQTYQIEYSFSGRAKITHIEVGAETESMVVSLMTTSDSRLRISMPPELVEYVFPNGKATGIELVAFVDEVHADMNQTVDSRTGYFTFEMAIEKGSVQLELVGNMLI
jgi:hypothetical protein